MPREKRELQVSTPEPSIGQMLQGALTSVQQGEITSQHVEVLSKMMDLYERNEKRQAEKDFAAALVGLQGAAVQVEATKPVNGNDGTVRYRFAPYNEIMSVVQPMLTAHGFSVTFDTTEGENRLTSICTLTHKGGHSRSNKFAVRYSKPPGSSDPQGDMSTKNYAKRGALCDCLNIVVGHDDDARMIGKTIAKAEAEELEARAKACGADLDALLKYASAANFESIPDDRYDSICAILERKERGKAPPKKYVEEKDPETGEYLI